ncbi:MAG: CpaD family pilus assembly lipoprotein [Alphaproteobacteria bacterium]|nr:CpaD family pilus assembly lipoprotein [Alphaproteobacteria bacterium]
MKQTNSLRLCLSCLVLLAVLGGCDTTMGPKPDNRIKLMPSADSKRTIAVPPECLSWHDAANDPLANTPTPQYGCATARNLAAQVERPEDLAEGKPLGTGDGVLSAASIQNYRAGRTKPLIDAKADAPLAQTPTGAGATP